MTRTVIDIDDEALAEAAVELGTDTKRDTVNAALREISARRRRLRALKAAQQLVIEGGLDLDLLKEKKNYRW